MARTRHHFQLLIKWYSHLPLSHVTVSEAQVQISSAYQLPVTYLACMATRRIIHLRFLSRISTSLLFPISSLFMIVGSSSSIDGGIFKKSATALIGDFVSHGVGWKNRHFCGSWLIY